MVELLAAMLVATLLAFAALPPLVEIIHNSRLKAAATRVAADLQQARSRAVSTGWEYRVAGFSTAASDEHRNQYRIMARSSVSIVWPDATTGAFESPTQSVGEWVDVDQLYSGIMINDGNTDEFAVTFDARGIPVERSLNFDPLEVSNDVGIEKFLTVSAVGSVAID